MNFTWVSGCSDVAKTINTMIKYKSGGWNSFKQKRYVSTRIIPIADACFPRDAENAKMFGVDLNPGEFGLILEGYTRWAEYGRKSVRRSGWFYVMNESGVLRKYKLGYRYADNGNFSEPDKAKLKLEWERPAALVITMAAPEAPPIVPSTSKFLGHEKERIESTLVLKRVIIRGYGTFGRMYLSVFNTTNGDVVFYNNILQDAEEGGTYNVSFSVKQHIVSKGNENVTVASRMSFTAKQKLLNRLAS